MRPHLLLVLVLLAMATTCHSAPAPRPVAPVPLTNCSLLSFAAFNLELSFGAAQDHCRTTLGGSLVSVHSSSSNNQLRNLARTHGCYGPWIGARTQGEIGHWSSHWEDGSTWNFANWGVGHPWHLIPTCASLRVTDGSWGSHPCLEQRPFICEYCGASTPPQ